MGIEFRTATPGDRAALLGFYAQAVKDLAATDNPCLWREGRYPLARDILPRLDAGSFVVACRTGQEQHDAPGEEPGEIVAAAVLDRETDPAYATLKWEGRDWMAIHLLCVAASVRRQGVADRLMGELIARARSGGADSIRLDVLVGNHPARRLYARHGFTGRGVLQLQLEDEEPLANQAMELLL
jgi:ribosomal protein S18 acetylase RimI-like enzyme